MIPCPCNAQHSFSSCCEPLITGKQYPQTPEALMRSRYTAYTLANIEYIQETMRGRALNGFDALEAKRWAKRVRWIKLNVIASATETANTGFVNFEVLYVEGSSLKSMHEKSQFIRELERWYYTDGTPLPTSYPEQTMTRNMTCPCGSQRKYKNCHAGRT